jgi:hypothetical protein
MPIFTFGALPGVLQGSWSTPGGIGNSSAGGGGAASAEVFGVDDDVHGTQATASHGNDDDGISTTKMQSPLGPRPKGSSDAFRPARGLAGTRTAPRGGDDGPVFFVDAYDLWHRDSPQWRRHFWRRPQHKLLHLSPDAR